MLGAGAKFDVVPLVGGDVARPRQASVEAQVSD